MSSSLRYNLDPQSTQSYYPGSKPTSPAKKQRMSLTQTYYIASTARTKLGREASKPDHNLRVLVGHANLLDTLMVELQDAEREQEAWFNESIKAKTPQQAARHVQWIDAIAEELEEDSSDEEEDSDDEDSIYDEDSYIAPSYTPSYAVSTMEVEDEEFEDFEYDDEHALTRVGSHPPELVHGDSDSEDDSMPPSPTQSAMDLSEQSQRAQPIKTTPYLDKMNHNQHDILADDIILSQRQSPMISAY